MSIVDSGQGWSCLSEYYTDTAGPKGTLQYRTYSKVNDGPAIMFWSTGGYRTLNAIGLSADTVKMITSDGGGAGPMAEFDYLGFHWYWCGGDYGFSNGTPVSTFPILPIKTEAVDLTEANFLYVMETANVELTGPSYTVEFNSTGGTGTMANQIIEVDVPTPLTACSFTKEDRYFAGWSLSSQGPVQYTDQEVVTNLAPEGETVVLYAVWRAEPPQIFLQYNASDHEHLDKDITDVRVLTGIFREDCTLENPVILIEAMPDSLVGVNYFTISAFSRSYYLTGQRIIRNNLIEISGHVDVLSSFKEHIRLQTGIVSRGESAALYNLYLNDGSLRTYQNPYVLTEIFPNGFTGTSYILSVAGSAQ